MDDEFRMRQLRIASQRYIYEVGKLPYPDAIGSLHAGFAELVAHNFEIKQKPWLNSYELAAVANYASLYGTTKAKPGRRFDFAPPLNALKALWKLAEDEGEYSEMPASEAAFTLRWVYQQIPFSLHPSRVKQVISLVHETLSTSELDQFLKSALGIASGALGRGSIALIDLFSRQHKVTEREYRALDGDMKLLIAKLAANRLQRALFHKSKLRVESPAEMPYELNTLLRFPIAKFDEDYYVPYPELIGYAATRGLFFRFSEEHGDAFRAPFVASFEARTAEIVSKLLPEAEILTEQDERRLGWKGKTNDVTAIYRDCALLIECKLSALFVEAKRTASLAAIIADIRKQVADGRDRRGLFQLHEKCEAIRSKILPPLLNQKYEKVERIFPVLLLFDAISFANAPEILGNIVKDELSAFGVSNFEYQVWHFEELSWLAEYAGTDALDWIAEKFSSAKRVYDLNSFIADKTGQRFLRPCMFMPEGETRAWKVLKKLSSQYRHDLLD